MTSKIRVPAKVILFGEYAVVKGSKAISFAINKFGTAEKASGCTVIDPFRKIDLSDKFHTREGIQINLEVMLGSGLGTSAIISVFLAQNNFDCDNKQIIKIQDTDFENIKIGDSDTYNNEIINIQDLKNKGIINIQDFDNKNPIKIQDLDNNQTNSILNHALQIENVFHGVSSGLDVTTCFVTGLIAYQNHSFKRLNTKYLRKYKIMIFNSKISKNTKTASSKWLMTDDMVNKINEISNEAEILLSRDFELCELYKLIRRNQDILDEIKIVPDVMGEEIRRLRLEGIESKVTGAGHGGHLVTVVRKGVNIEGWEEVCIYEGGEN